MNDFKRGGQNFGGNRNNKRGFGGGGGRNMSRPDMHKAVCSDCGNNCEVPFRPSGDKPVFCSDCFKKQGGGNSRDRENRNFGDSNARPSFNSKPAYQSSPSTNTENYKAQFEQLNSKLDRILKAIAPIVSKETKEIKVATSVKPDISKEIKEIKALVKKTASAKPKAKKAVKKATGKKKK